MAILLSLAAAIIYGGADFIGGVTTRRSSALAVVLLSELAGFGLLAALVPLFGGSPSGAVLWGGASGLAGAAGVVLLYRGLALGPMAVVAPITAVEAASVPVFFGLLIGERPSSSALLGVAVALVAIVLVSSADDARDSPGFSAGNRPGVAEALGAGLAFGAYFILLERAGDESGLWALITGRTVSIAAVGALAAMKRTQLRTDRLTAIGIVLAGFLDVTANVFYVLALQEGLLALVAVVTSMYPASTVVLARVVLRERFRVPQLAGLGLAAAGVVLIAFG
jgi:drug/metabolite transporter (DMT)-like permease